MHLKRLKGSSSKTGLCKLEMSTECSIYSVAGLKEAFDENIDKYTRFEIDMSAVEEVDSAGIQLLLAFFKEVKRQGKSAQITAKSDAISKVVDTFGVADKLEVAA